MRYSPAVIALFTAASLSAPAAATGSDASAPALETVVISAETICAEMPGDAYCRGHTPAVSTPSARKPAPAGDVWASRLGEIEQTAPWIRGHVRWCEAFPSEPTCLGRPSR